MLGLERSSLEPTTASEVRPHRAAVWTSRLNPHQPRMAPITPRTFLSNSPRLKLTHTRWKTEARFERRILRNAWQRRMTRESLSLMICAKAIKKTLPNNMPLTSNSRLHRCRITVRKVFLILKKMVVARFKTLRNRYSG